MSEITDPVLLGLLFWTTPGMVVALAFLSLGIDRVDPQAIGAYAFRPLLIPGLVLLWPLVVWRWATHVADREG
jgi:hypothetical protein